MRHRIAEERQCLLYVGSSIEDHAVLHDQEHVSYAQLMMIWASYKGRPSLVVST